MTDLVSSSVCRTPRVRARPGLSAGAQEGALGSGWRAGQSPVLGWARRPGEDASAGRGVGAVLLWLV